MADIRINALATTAASTASDDFIAVDGSANGTRKLNAYSPTFGGNLTVSGTGTTGGNLSVRNALGYATGIHTGTTSDSTQQLLLSSNAAYNHAYISKGSTTLGIGFSSDNGSFVADDSITITAATKLVTLAGNLTVSGRDLTLGSSESVIYFGTPSANYLYYNGSSLFLRVGSVDRITIPSSTGNVLIGTTTDGGQKLQVSGTAYVSGDATFAGTVIAGTWSSGTADKLKVSTAVNDYAAYFANIASSGGSYGIRLHTNTTAATDYLLVATSGAGGGSTRFIIKSNGTLNAPSLPTSSAGLSAGDIWNDGGTLKIV